VIVAITKDEASPLFPGRGFRSLADLFKALPELADELLSSGGKPSRQWVSMAVVTTNCEQFR